MTKNSIQNCMPNFFAMHLPENNQHIRLYNFHPILYFFWLKPFYYCTSFCSIWQRQRIERESNEVVTRKIKFKPWQNYLSYGTNEISNIFLKKMISGSILSTKTCTSGHYRISLMTAQTNCCDMFSSWLQDIGLNHDNVKMQWEISFWGSIACFMSFVTALCLDRDRPSTLSIYQLSIINSNNQSKNTLLLQASVITLLSAMIPFITQQKIKFGTHLLYVDTLSHLLQPLHSNEKRSLYVYHDAIYQSYTKQNRSFLVIYRNKYRLLRRL